MKVYILAVLLVVPFSLSAQKPHVLWITIEDTSPHFIGCYGNRDARTPVIDSLARTGVQFRSAFSTGTVCAPSRSTIITGVRTYASGTGNHRSQLPLPDFVKGFPYYLRQQGYYVTNNRKTDYNIHNEKEFIAETWDKSSADAGWWGRKPGQPFFSVLNFEDSHQSRTMTHPYDWYEKHILERLPAEERIEPHEFSMPPFYRDSEEMRRHLARTYNSITYTDKKIGELLDRLKEDQLMDSTIIFFFSDHGQGIPRGKTNGINFGYRVPFIIWFPPAHKHLSPWEIGAATDELITFEDLAPTMVALSGADVPDHLQGRVLLGRKRSAPLNKVFLSTDRSDNGIDMVRNVTDGRYFYSRNFMPFVPELKYIRYMEVADIKKQMREDLRQDRLDRLQSSMFEARPAESLYDLQDDPWETRNLLDQPEVQDILREMRGDAEENILRSRDIMLLPEYELKRISEKMTPYEFRSDHSRYPVQEIFKAVRLSGKQGADIARQQARLLRDDNDIARYWAITGLRSQSANVVRQVSADVRQAMNDEYPPVAITASAILYDFFGDARAEENLKSYVAHANTDLALTAINYLLYVQHPEPFVQTVKAVYEDANIPYDLSAAAKDFLGKLRRIENNWDTR